LGPYWMIFELLFLLIALATIVAILTALVFAIRGQRQRALRILGVLAICLGVYFAVCCFSTMFTPRRELNIGEPQCFDDWCIQLDGVTRNPSGSKIHYQTVIRVFSTAKRVFQRENGVVPYLEDDRGHRYAAVPDSSATPFNILLQPGESVTIARGFELPVGAHVAGFMAAHEGGFPIGWFVIGEGQGLFHKEAITRFQ
jgi:hypothetical protein